MPFVRYVFHQPVADFIQNVDLLYHEATFTEELKEWAKKTWHSTAADAARMAKLVNAKQLIIGHFSARYKKIAPFTDEAKTIFEATVAAVDGKTYRVEKPACIG